MFTGQSAETNHATIWCYFLYKNNNKKFQVTNQILPPYVKFCSVQSVLGCAISTHVTHEDHYYNYILPGPALYR